MEMGNFQYIIMEDYGNERKQASLTSEDQKAINNRDKINSWNEFK